MPCKRWGLCRTLVPRCLLEDVCLCCSVVGSLLSLLLGIAQDVAPLDVRHESHHLSYVSLFRPFKEQTTHATRAPNHVTCAQHTLEVRKPQRECPLLQRPSQNGWRPQRRARCGPVSAIPRRGDRRHPHRRRPPLLASLCRPRMSSRSTVTAQATATRRPRRSQRTRLRV